MFRVMVFTGGRTSIERVFRSSRGFIAWRAVVALESTIISHGMPYPQNLATAKEVEGIVRANGAVSGLQLPFWMELRA
ncbi:unnamed protein product [Rhodiola kirilowii]